MAFLTFRGGIHPYDGKDLSKNCPVEKYLPKGDLAILVSQHIGAPATPIVQKGDKVKVIMCLQDRKSQKQEDLFPHRYTRLYQEP